MKANLLSRTQEMRAIVATRDGNSMVMNKAGCSSSREAQRTRSPTGRDSNCGTTWDKHFLPVAPAEGNDLGHSSNRAPRQIQNLTVAGFRW
jgi:hypothetical protein